jgi:hypothetical protein
LVEAGHPEDSVPVTLLKSGMHLMMDQDTEGRVFKRMQVV